MSDRFTALLNALPYTPTSGREVRETSELRRIRDAKRAPWQDAPDLVEGCKRLNEWLRMPGGSKELKLSQAATLRALHDRRGCFAPLLPGEGKTGISLAAPTVMQSCLRPLLVVPANARSKTIREHARDYAPHFRLLPLLEVTAANKDALERIRRGRYPLVSYQSIASTNWDGFLDSYAPDLIVLDECHLAKNTRAKVTRRLSRYIRHKHPVVLAMSGSIENRSAREWWHIAKWCLGDASPLPVSVEELQEWCWALDEKVAKGTRMNPGALLTLMPEQPGDDVLAQERLTNKEGDEEPELLHLARVRFGRRLKSTEGVVASVGGLPPIGIVAEEYPVEPDELTKKLVKEMRETWETPCGLPFELQLDMWRHEREMSCGLYQRWKKQPPPEWMAARKGWSKAAREILQHSKKLDSAMDLAKALDQGSIYDPAAVAALAEWRRVKPMFDPETEAVWFSDTMLNVAAEWLAEEPQGICWVHHREFGFELSNRTGLPYFGDNASDKTGRQVDQVFGTAIIASINSCGVTWNLQYHSRNLVVTCPTTGRMIEQMMARTHRPGQEADDVSFRFLQMLDGDRAALQQARADARNFEAKMAPQRILAATWL